MKNKKYIITLLIIVSLNFVYGQKLSYEGKKKAQTAINCIEHNDYYCGLINLEQLLKKYGSEMNSYQSNSVKKVLINCYYEVSMERGKNNNPNFKDLCIKGIKLGKEINETNDINAFMFHYMIIVYYRYLENETKMNEWIRKLNKISKHLNTKPDIKKQLLDWANVNIRYMRSSLNKSNTSTSYSFSLGDLISKKSNRKKKTSRYRKNTSTKIVTKTVKCCNDKHLGDKVIVYHLYTNKNEKISVYYYPHLDKWHFKNGWGEKFRGNKFYDSLGKIIEYIENEK